MNDVWIGFKKQAFENIRVSIHSEITEYTVYNHGNSIKKSFDFEQDLANPDN